MLQPFCGGQRRTAVERACFRAEAGGGQVSGASDNPQLIERLVKDVARVAFEKRAAAKRQHNSDK